MSKYRFLIAVIFMQFISYSTALSCIQCGTSGGTPCTSNLTATLCPDSNTTYAKCFIQFNATGTIRGCKTEEESKTCTTANNCLQTEDSKNNQIVCKNCATTDEKCSQTDMTTYDSQYMKICDADIKTCITKLDNKLVVRGCATDTEAAQCTDEKTCKKCTTDQCNTGIFPADRIHCYQCNGSTCGDVATNSIVSTPCLNYVSNDQCYTKGENATAMTRGCNSDTRDNQCSSTSGDRCTFCSTDNCNNLNYQYNQTLKCFQCTGNDTNTDCFKAQTGTDFQDCQNKLFYNQTGYCYTQRDGDKIERGCLYDNAAITLDTCKDDDSNSSCNKCNTSNGCNSAAVSYEFTCIVCRSDLNEKCRNDANTLTGQTCRTSNSSAAEGCFYGLWNGIAIRGCLVDASVQNQEICKDPNNYQCNVCNKKDCNTGKTSGSGQLNVTFALLLIAATTLWNFK